MDILVNQGGINPNFIEDAVPEFILYWRDRGDVSSTWDSKFIQHVRPSVAVLYWYDGSRHDATRYSRPSGNPRNLSTMCCKWPTLIASLLSRLFLSLYFTGRKMAHHMVPGVPSFCSM
jgi:hypothetical protein